jgi:hypothetical protein
MTGVFPHLKGKDKVCDKCHKKQVQATVDEVQGDSLIVKEVLEGNNDDDDYPVRDTAL